jgi:hypothetical protein
MQEKTNYPRTLSAGANNTVIALGEHEVGKLFATDTRSDLGSEAAKMRFANAVNSLVVKFIRLDVVGYAGEEIPILVMERLYPHDFRSYEREKRVLWCEVFEDELRALHRAGFVHRDICRPSEGIGGERYDNVFLTQQGLRLIDVGISALRESVGERLFERFVEQELHELREFREYFIHR